MEFPTGEIVRMKHKCRGIDNEGRLIIHSDVQGNVPDVDLGTQIDIKVGTLIISILDFKFFINFLSGLY